jgi:hypothetical protein
MEVEAYSKRMAVAVRRELRQADGKRFAQIRLHAHQVIHSRSSPQTSSPLPCQVRPWRSSVRLRISTNRPPPPNTIKTLADAVAAALRSACVDR